MRSLPAQIAGAVSLVLLAFLSLPILAHCPFPDLGQKGYDLLVTASLFLAAWGTGKLLLKDSDRVELQTAAGLGVISIEMLLLGALGLWTEGVLRGLLGAHLLIGLFYFRFSILDFRLWCSQLRDSLIQNRKSKIENVLVFAPLLLSLIAALAPPSFYDTLVYHLGLPNFYLREHRLMVPAANPYASFPQLMEMLFTLLLGVGSVCGPSLLVWGMGALLVLAMIRFGSRVLDEETGWLAAALLAAAPCFMLLSSDAYVDVPLAFYTFLGVGLFFENRKTDLLLSGLMLGFAFSVKYTGAMGIILVTTGLLIQRRNPIVFLAAAALTASPWLIKNAVTVGNPVFPFFYTLFPGAMSPWPMETAGNYFKILSEYHGLFENLSNLWVFPWALAWGSPRFGGGFDVLGNVGWALPVGLMVFIPAARPLSAAQKRLAWFTLGFYLLWASTRPVSRFFLPAMPLMLLLGAGAYRTWVTRSSLSAQRASRLLIGVVLAGQFLFFFHVQGIVGKLKTGLGLETAHHFLSSKLNYYPALDFVNHRLADDARVLVVGDQRSHYLERRHVVMTVCAPNPLVSAIDDSRGPEQIREWLRARGITHLLINRAELKRLSGYGFFAFTPDGEKRWQTFLTRHGRGLFRDRACDLVEIL